MQISKKFSVGCLLLSVTACGGGEATQLLAMVNSNLVVSSTSALGITSVSVHVAEEGVMIGSNEIQLTTKTNPVPASFTLPLTFGVLGDDESTVEVTVSALHEGTLLFSRVARTGFSDGKMLLLPMFLAGRCLTEAQRCMAGSTCTQEGCAPVDVDVTTLDEVTREQFENDDYDQNGSLPGNGTGSNPDEMINPFTASCPQMCKDDLRDKFGCLCAVAPPMTCMNTCPNGFVDVTKNCDCKPDPTCTPLAACPAMQKFTGPDHCVCMPEDQCPTCRVIGQQQDPNAAECACACPPNSEDIEGVCTRNNCRSDERAIGLLCFPQDGKHCEEDITSCDPSQRCISIEEGKGGTACDGGPESICVCVRACLSETDCGRHNSCFDPTEDDGLSCLRGRNCLCLEGCDPFAPTSCTEFENFACHPQEGRCLPKSGGAGFAGACTRGNTDMGGTQSEIRCEVGLFCTGDFQSGGGGTAGPPTGQCTRPCYVDDPGGCGTDPSKYACEPGWGPEPNRGQCRETFPATAFAQLGNSCISPSECIGSSGDRGLYCENSVGVCTTSCSGMDSCGPDHLCAPKEGSLLGICLASCDDATPCPTDHVCQPLGDVNGPKYCTTACNSEIHPRCPAQCVPATGLCAFN